MCPSKISTMKQFVATLTTSFCTCTNTIYWTSWGQPIIIGHFLFALKGYAASSTDTIQSNSDENLFHNQIVSQIAFQQYEQISLSRHVRRSLNPTSPSYKSVLSPFVSCREWKLNSILFSSKIPLLAHHQPILAFISFQTISLTVWDNSYTNMTTHTANSVHNFSIRSSVIQSSKRDYGYIFM